MGIGIPYTGLLYIFAIATVLELCLTGRSNGTVIATHVHYNYIICMIKDFIK